MARSSTRRRFLGDVSTGLALVGAAPYLGCDDAATATATTKPDAAPRTDGAPATTVPTGYFHDPRLADHRHSTERPERILAIEQHLEATGLGGALSAITPVADPLPAIARVHSAEHVAGIRGLEVTGEVAELAVAGVLGAVDAVCTGRLERAFCAVRPPGHHVQNQGRGEGFCYYANVAIAARHAQVTHGVERVLIVDWDYHHGNGTEWAFYDDPSVLFFSTHRRGDYPGTGDPARRGTGAGEGYNINVDLPCQTDDAAILAAFDERLAPAAEAFDPELVLISAGFDGKRDDALGCFEITPCGFAALTGRVVEIARAHAGGRIVSVLEGGYADASSLRDDHVDAFLSLAEAVAAHVDALRSAGAPGCGTS